MNTRDFRAYVEENSRSGSALCFVDQYSPEEYRAGPGGSYTAEALLVRGAVTIYIARSERPADALDRDAFVGMLRGAEGEYGANAKCQVVLYDAGGASPRAYLFDTMWSHVSSREENVFEFTAPVDEGEIHKGPFDRVIDFVTNPSLDGGC